MNRLSQPNLERASNFETPGLRVEGAPRIHLEKSLPGLPPALENLKAIVLLAGAVGPSAFRASLDRAIVDLPIEAGRTVLSHWQDHCRGLANSLGINHLPVRLLVDQAAQLPSDSSASEPSIRLTIERDPSEFRGTGGLLRDVAQGHGGNEWLLVTNAVQLLRTPLSEAAFDLARQSAPVVVVSHEDGTPSGIMLIRCDCLAGIPEIGFIDMKEQGLGIIAKRHSVKVLQRAAPTGYPIRTYVNYLTSLRRYHAGADARSNKREDWESCFAIVEEGAGVAAGATVHDSVVLKGGRVEKGAVVINSVVCAGGVVRRGQTVTDELVTASGRR
jgi:hypothetical protein